MRRLNARRQRGFTLVETMVTVFVVAIGLLSAAALQAVSKKAALDAMQRSAATVVAQDMIERIRANNTRAALDAYALNGKEIHKAPEAPACGDTSNCSSVALVGYDLSRWWQSLDGSLETISDGSSNQSAGGLRDPAGCIRVNGNQVDVVVTWRGMTQTSQVPEIGDTEDPTADPCGINLTNVSGGNLYEKEGSNSYRRVLRIRAFVPT